MIHTILGDLNVPVTELIPYEIVYLRKGNTQFEFIQVLCNILHQCIACRQNPLICRHQFRGFRLRYILSFHIHKDETRRIPYLIGKITACLYSFIIETHVITRRITCDQCHTKCICTILIDNIQRVDTIAQRFTHLTSL